MDVEDAVEQKKKKSDLRKINGFRYLQDQPLNTIIIETFIQIEKLSEILSSLTIYRTFCLPEKNTFISEHTSRRTGAFSSNPEEKTKILADDFLKSWER